MLCRFSRVSLFTTLWTDACQTPLSMRFSRQEYWSGFPCPPPGDLGNPEMEPMSPMAPTSQADSVPLSHWGSPQCRRPGFNPWIRKFPWRREWLLTPVFLPEKAHGQRSLAGYCPWLCKRVGHNWATKQQ